jgi:hypothetical protein
LFPCVLLSAPACDDDSQPAAKDSKVAGDGPAADGPLSDVSAADGPAEDGPAKDGPTADGPAAPDAATVDVQAQTDAPACKALPGANSYYVDGQNLCGTCSDTRTRAQNTITAPWCTVGRATQVLQAGDTVYVREGTYNEGISIKTGGAAGKPIVYAAFPHEKPELKSGIPVHIEVSHVQVVGLHLTLTGSYGIRVQNADHVVLKQNTIYSVDQNGSKCIYLNSVSDVKVLDNDISFSDDGVHSSGKLVNVDFIGNQIIGRPTIFPSGAHPDGMQFRSSPLDNVRIVNNVIYHGESANLFLQAIGGGPWKNVVVAGNLLYQDCPSGLCGKQIHFSPVQTLLIEGNTLVTESPGGSGYTHGISIGASTAVTVRNNVLYNSIYFWSPSFTSDYNLLFKSPANSKPLVGSYQTLAALKAANPGKEQHSVEGDPLFKDAAKGDFSLKTSSPGKDKGTACAETKTDLNGKSRPQGAGWDMGAYE